MLCSLMTVLEHEHRPVPANEFAAPSQHAYLCAFHVNLDAVDMLGTNDVVQRVDMYLDLPDFLLWIWILDFAQPAPGSASNDDIEGCFTHLVAQRHVEHARARECTGEVLKILRNRLEREMAALRSKFYHLSQDIAAVTTHVDAV